MAKPAPSWSLLAGSRHQRPARCIALLRILTAHRLHNIEAHSGHLNADAGYVAQLAQLADNTNAPLAARKQPGGRSVQP
jgi:hypothetical protein